MNWIEILFWSSLAIFGICSITEAMVYCYGDYSDKTTKVMYCCFIGVIVSGVIIVGFLLMALIIAISKI